MVVAARDWTIHVVTSILGTVDPAVTGRNATSMGSRFVRNGNLESSLAYIGVGFRIGRNTTKPTRLLLLVRMGALAGYEHPQPL